VLNVDPFEEPGTGGIGPEHRTTYIVSAEVNLLQALGPQLHGSLTGLPPDMRVLARKEMPTDVSWHRAYEVFVVIDSQLDVHRVPAYEYPDHMGTATATGVLDVATVHAPGVRFAGPPEIGSLLTVTDAGRGPSCTIVTTGLTAGAEGAMTMVQNSGTIDFQVVDAVIYPPEELKLYLDVGPADDFHDDKYHLTQCREGEVVYSDTQPGTNFWEFMIFRGYPRGLSFSGVTMSGNGPAIGTTPGVWNWRATADDWDGDGEFEVASWETPQTCGGYCTEDNSWLNIQIFAKAIPDP
jgi:hypothetical protein